MGIHQMMFAVSGSTNVPANNAWSVIASNAGNSTASISFASDGTVNSTGSVNVDSQNITNWYSPTTASIGNSYWIRFTQVSINGIGTGTLGTWLALSSARTLSMSTGGGANVEWSLTAEIASDSGGTNIVGGGTILLQATDTTK